MRVWAVTESNKERVRGCRAAGAEAGPRLQPREWAEREKGEGREERNGPEEKLEWAEAREGKASAGPVQLGCHGAWAEDRERGREGVLFFSFSISFLSSNPNLKYGLNFFEPNKLNINSNILFNSNKNGKF